MSTRPDLELPDARFIAIHAACCRAAHLSGAAEYVEMNYRDMEETPVLAADGSSGHLLHSALSSLVLADPAGRLIDP